jgi:hypothetical protein
MSKEIQALLDKYIRWLKEKTVLRQVGDWTEITTPRPEPLARNIPALPLPFV